MEESIENSTFDPLLEFENFYRGSFSKWTAILVTALNVITLTPLCFAIVWYERFRANGNQTLINQAIRIYKFLTLFFSSFKGVQNFNELGGLPYSHPSSL